MQNLTLYRFSIRDLLKNRSKRIKIIWTKFMMPNKNDITLLLWLQKNKLKLMRSKMTIQKKKSRVSIENYKKN
jgi:hypothetical protein